VPSELGQLTSLTASLYLHDNSFTGPIPTQLGMLTKLQESLALSGNKLTGPIPSELGQLTRLTHFLHLNDNALSGELPSELGKLTGLTAWFYAFNNRLCGAVPPEVAALADGTTGSIPTSAALPNWALYTGNDFNFSCDATRRPSSAPTGSLQPTASGNALSPHQAALAALFVALSVCIVFSSAGYAIRRAKLRASNTSYSAEETERMSKLFGSADRLSQGRSTSRERAPPSSLEALEHELGQLGDTSGSSRRRSVSPNRGAMV
jgi:hypothetical protein